MDYEKIVLFLGGEINIPWSQLFNIFLIGFSIFLYINLYEHPFRHKNPFRYFYIEDETKSNALKMFMKIIITFVILMFIIFNSSFLIGVLGFVVVEKPPIFILSSIVLIVVYMILFLLDSYENFYDEIIVDDKK
ncbi:MAG: hypothetical protein ACK5LY_08350 [Lachnospirales bacterium]